MRYFLLLKTFYKKLHKWYLFNEKNKTTICLERNIYSKTSFNTDLPIDLHVIFQKEKVGQKRCRKN